MFKALLFDMDGTLVDSEEITLDALDETLKQYGHYLAPELRDFVSHHAWDKVIDRLYATWDDLPDVRRLLDETLCLKGEIMAAGNVPLLPGTIDVFQRLRPSAKTAIVSGSFSHEIAFLVNFLDARSEVDFTLGGDQITKHKPDPESFLTAAKHLGVAPEDCLVIEDSPFGIQSGVDAGMAVVAVKAGNRYAYNQSKAHFSLETLNDLTPQSLQSLHRQWTELLLKEKAS